MISFIKTMRINAMQSIWSVETHAHVEDLVGGVGGARPGDWGGGSYRDVENLR